MRCYADYCSALDEVQCVADHATELLNSGNRSDRPIANAITRSGLVLLCGYFEGFIRDLAEECIESINELALSPCALPLKLLSEVLAVTMEEKNGRREHKVAELVESIRSGAAWRVDGRRLSVTKGNPSVETVESLFAPFGLERVIDQLSIADFPIESTFVTERQSALVEAQLAATLGCESDSLQHVLAVIDQRWGPKTRRRDVGYVSAIQELLKKRNRIAHGEAREMVTPSDLSNHVMQMRGLGVGLNRLSDQLISGLRPSGVEVACSSQ